MDSHNKMVLAQAINLIAYVNVLIALVPIANYPQVIQLWSSIFWSVVLVVTFVVIIMIGSIYASKIAPDTQKISSDLSYVVKYMFPNFGLYTVIILVAFGFKYTVDILTVAGMVTLIIFYTFYTYTKLSFVTFDGQKLKAYKFSSKYVEIDIKQCTTVERHYSFYMFAIEYRDANGKEKKIYFYPRNNFFLNEPEPVTQLKYVISKEKTVG
jgi:hypothetical protein